MAETSKMDRNLALEAVRVTEAAALVGLAADGARRREGGRPGRGRCDAQALNSLDDRRHRRHRRGRARRGADALYRREGRHRQRPARSTSRSIRSKARRSPPRAAPMRSPSSRWPTPAAFSTRPTSIWTRSRSAAGCPTMSSISTKTPAANLKNLAQAKKAEVADLVVCILDRPRHAELIAKVRERRRPHHADRRRRCQRRHRDLEPGDRHRHVYRLGRRARRRAGGGGVALHRRPDAGPAVVPQRRRARPRAPARHHRPQPQIQALGSGLGRCDVRRDRRHQRHDAASGVRRFPGGAVDPFGGDALEDRHRALRRGAATISPASRASPVRAMRRRRDGQRRHSAKRNWAGLPGPGPRIPGAMSWNLGEIDDRRFFGVERSVCGRRWRLRAADDTRGGKRSPSGLALPEIVGRLLAQRGVDLDEAPGFLSPRLRDQLPDPAHLRDMEAAAARLVRAVRDGETIAVFGDYDVDGATSAALLAAVFCGGRRPHPGLRPRPPARRLWPQRARAVAVYKPKGARVVVTVDCGTTAHLPLAEAAESRARRHRRRSSCRRAAAAARGRGGQPEPARRGEPARQLWRRSAWPFCSSSRSIARCAGPAGMPPAAPSPTCCGWLDLVALGTVCDVVPLTGLNRALVAQGIKVARRSGNPGLAALARGRRRQRAARRLPSGLRPRAAGQCRRPGRRRRSRRAAAGDRRSGARRRSARSVSTRYNRERRDIEARDPGGGDRDGRSGGAIAGAGLCGGGGLASRRDRHRRGAAQGAL